MSFFSNYPGGGGVTTINTLSGNVTLAAGSGITITPAGNTLTIASTDAGGTVTSVAMSVPAFLSISGSPITTSGTLALSLSGTALPIANGGTGQTSAANAINALLPSQTSNSGKFLTTNGSVSSWGTAGGGGLSAPVVYPYIIQTSPYTISASTDYLVLINASSAGATVTLPASPSNGQVFIIRNTGITNNTLTLAANAGQQLDPNAASPGTIVIRASKTCVYNLSSTTWYQV